MTEQTKEQRVEELEDEYYAWSNRWSDEANNQLKQIKQQAIQLKEEIEKGCGKKLVEYEEDDRQHYVYCGKNFDEIYCPNCQNLIQRLNKIIREEPTQEDLIGDNRFNLNGEL